MEIGAGSLNENRQGGGTGIEPEPQITQTLDLETLASGWQAITDRNTGIDDDDALRPHLHAVLDAGAKTDLGCVRENNEDKFDLLEPRQPGVLAAKGRIYGIADGMGGHSAGQVASEIALKTLISAYYADPSLDPEYALRRSAILANDAVYANSQTLPERQGMGTTLTAVVVREDCLYVVHVGDSRAYLARRGEPMRQITQDHSWVAEQVRAGAMSWEEANASPYRNIILRSVGTAPSLDADVNDEQLKPGDVVILCSDGLTGHLEDDEIAAMASPEAVAKYGASLTALRLTELALERGGKDNVTVLVILVEAIRQYADKDDRH